jgi:hypothetical protein
MEISCIRISFELIVLTPPMLPIFLLAAQDLHELVIQIIAIQQLPIALWFDAGATTSIRL